MPLQHPSYKCRRRRHRVHCKIKPELSQNLYSIELKWTDRRSIKVFDMNFFPSHGWIQPAEPITDGQFTAQLRHSYSKRKIPIELIFCFPYSCHNYSLPVSAALDGYAGAQPSPKTNITGMTFSFSIPMCGTYFLFCCSVVVIFHSHHFRDT